MAYVVEKRQSIERALEEGSPDGFLGDEEMGADLHLLISLLARYADISGRTAY